MATCSQLKLPTTLQKLFHKECQRDCRIWMLSHSPCLNTSSPYIWCLSKNVKLVNWSQVKKKKKKLYLAIFHTCFCVAVLNAVFICISFTKHVYRKPSLQHWDAHRNLCFSEFHLSLEMWIMIPAYAKMWWVMAVLS